MPKRGTRDEATLKLDFPKFSHHYSMQILGGKAQLFGGGGGGGGKLSTLGGKLPLHSPPLR